MDELQEWTTLLSAELGLDAGGFDQCPEHALVLAMARDVGRVVTKPAGPVAAYLAGMAVARGLTPIEVAGRLSELKSRWPRVDWRD